MRFLLAFALFAPAAAQTAPRPAPTTPHSLAGYPAHLVAVLANPLARIEVLEHVNPVVEGGAFVRASR